MHNPGMMGMNGRPPPMYRPQMGMPSPMGHPMPSSMAMSMSNPQLQSPVAPGGPLNGPPQHSGLTPNMMQMQADPSVIN